MKKFKNKYRLFFTLFIVSIIISAILLIINNNSSYNTFIELVFMLFISSIILLIFCIIKINIFKRKLLEEKIRLNPATYKIEQIKRLQQCLNVSEKNYTLLFERMLNGFFVFEPVINKDGKLVDIRFLDVNPSFENQTGVSANEIIGKTWIDVFEYPNEDLRIYHNILSSGEAENFETYYGQGDIYYLVNAFKFADNKVGVIFDNITEYKQAIKQITMLNEELEQRVIQRTNELQGAVNELEAFAYIVSHDLKSPLRAIDSYSRIIIEDFGSNIKEDGNEIMQNIRNICSDMIDMINKLLQYSTTVKADIHREQIDLEEMFIRIFNELNVEYKDRSIKLIIETGLPLVFADRVMFRQVIYNILSNSIKYTKYKKNAFITVGCTITGMEYVFYVKDNGAGFDMDFSEKLFSIFERLHTSDEFEGSGIGLATIKKIIQKHGGRVWIEAELNEGATVHFTLPIS